MPTAKKLSKRAAASQIRKPENARKQAKDPLNFAREIGRLL